MPEILVIADDLTGANATGVLLARQGMSCTTFLAAECCEQTLQSGRNVVAVSTDSRSCDADSAYRKVAAVMDAVYDEKIKLINKRIDSTLRGNIGAEVRALLERMPEETLAIVVPVFPASGRVCIGGYLMVNQVPLEKTDAANEPKNPVKTSKVVTLLAKQLKEPVGFVELSEVMQGAAAVLQAIRRQQNQGKRIIVLDATTDEQVLEIAKAVKRSAQPILAVDPGPFTSALASLLGGAARAGIGQKVMVTVGSVTASTRRQLEELRRVHHPHLVNVSAARLIDLEQRDEEIQRVVNVLLAGVNSCDVIGVATSGWDSDILDLAKLARQRRTTELELSQRITSGLGIITRRAIEESGGCIGGLFTSGGDVSLAVCRELAALGIAVKDEVLPMAAYGRIRNGLFDNRPIVTKGGMIGDETAINKCVEYLRIKVSNEVYEKIPLLSAEGAEQINWRKNKASEKAIG